MTCTFQGVCLLGQFFMLASFFGLFLNPEKGSDNFHRNVSDFKWATWCYITENGTLEVVNGC